MSNGSLVQPKDMDKTTAYIDGDSVYDATSTNTSSSTWISSFRIHPTNTSVLYCIKY